MFNLKLEKMNRNNLLHLLVDMFKNDMPERITDFHQIVCEDYAGIFPELEKAIKTSDLEGIRSNLIAFCDSCSVAGGIQWNMWFRDDINSFDWVNNPEHKPLFFIEWKTRTRNGIRQYWRTCENREEGAKWCREKKSQDNILDLYLVCDLYQTNFRQRFTTNYEFRSML